MRREVYTSISHPVGEPFAAPALPAGALDEGAHSLVGSHVTADGANIVTLWHATVVEPDPVSDTEPPPAE
jgi:hypothetical protein